MKLYICVVVLVSVIIVECTHTFLGTNVQRHLVYHHDAKYSSKLFRKRVESIHFSMQNQYGRSGDSIKGILAYDLTDSGASANVTQGGVGYNFVDIRMKSDRGRPLHYMINIYA